MEVNVISQGGQNNNFNYIASNTTVNNSEGSTKNEDVKELANQNNVNSKQDTNYKGTDNKGVSEKDAKKAADKLNKLLEDKNTHIEYKTDDVFKNVMIMDVVDNDTNKVVNQIPSKQILDMVAQFCEMAGLILDKKA